MENTGTQDLINYAKANFESAESCSDEIKALTLKLIDLNQSLSQLKESQSNLKMQAKAAVGCAEGLKNDTQREGFQSNWLMQNGWGELSQSIPPVETEIEKVQVEIAWLRRRYELVLFHIQFALKAL